MKKTRFAALWICLLLCGCQAGAGRTYPDDGQFHFETDAQYTFFDQGWDRSFAESESGYYFAGMCSGGDFLFYTDKETLQTLPLCGKPNCLHHEETDDAKRQLCNAWFWGMDEPASVFYNDGRLFVPMRDSYGEDTVIMEFAADGSWRKELFRFEDTRVFSNNMLFHRGHFYLMVNSYTQDMKVSSRILQYSLEDPSREPKCLYQMESEKDGGTLDLIAYGNRLYFAQKDSGKKFFYSIDLATLETTRILDIAGEGDASYNLSVLNGRLLYGMSHPGSGSGSVDLSELDATLYTSALDGSDVQKWNAVKFENYNSDDRYVYCWMPYGGMHPELGETYLKIYDREGNLLVNYDMAQIPQYHMVFVSLSDQVFITTEARANVVYSFSKSEIETGEIHPKLLSH